MDIPGIMYFARNHLDNDPDVNAESNVHDHKNGPVPASIVICSGDGTEDLHLNNQNYMELNPNDPDPIKGVNHAELHIMGMMPESNQLTPRLLLVDGNFHDAVGEIRVSVLTVHPYGVDRTPPEGDMTTITYVVIQMNDKQL